MSDFLFELSIFCFCCVLAYIVWINEQRLKKLEKVVKK